MAPDGRVDIVWFDRRNAQTPIRPECNNPLSRPGLGDVYYASSSDAGVTFSPNRRMTDRMIDWDIGFDCRIASSNLLGPAVASLANGGAIAAWADTRDGSVRDNNQDIYLARITPQPLSVAHIQKPSGPALSVALSQLAYPGGAEFVGGNAINSSGGRLGPATTKVVVVNQKDVAGVLAGAVLARATNGPLLLSPASGLTPELKNEVSRIGPAAAYVIGSPSSLSTSVESQLRAVGVSGPVLRIAGSDPPDMARLVAKAIVDAVQAMGASPVDTAVLVDPGSDSAGAASNLAASLHHPVLFISKDQVPAATSQALTDVGIAHTLVVGDTGSLSAAVVGRLPSPRQLGGSDAAATSVQVARFALGPLPHNVVYSAPPSQPVQAAMLGAVVARLGGTLVLALGASQTEDAIGTLGVSATVDRVVLVSQTGGPSRRWVLPVLAFIFAALGAAFFVYARCRAPRGLPSPPAGDDPDRLVKGDGQRAMSDSGGADERPGWLAPSCAT